MCIIAVMAARELNGMLPTLFFSSQSPRGVEMISRWNPAPLKVSQRRFLRSESEVLGGLDLCSRWLIYGESFHCTLGSHEFDYGSLLGRRVCGSKQPELTSVIDSSESRKISTSLSF